MDLRAIVVPGEAPESDDETLSIKTGLGFPSLQTARTCGTIISGEAPESDDDGTSLSSVSGAIDAMVCQPYADVKIPKSKKNTVKYNSLLHKKLWECNISLDKNIVQLTEGTINTSVRELTFIHRQLLKTELTLQEAVCQLRGAASSSREALRFLRQTIDTDYLRTIKS